MKKFNMKMATTVVICGAFLCSSCIGSFGLHSRLLSWNQNIDDNKFVNWHFSHWLLYRHIPYHGWQMP